MSGLPLCRRRRSAFCVVLTLTTAGEYFSTSLVKSGSSRASAAAPPDQGPSQRGDTQQRIAQAHRRNGIHVILEFPVVKRSGRPSDHFRRASFNAVTDCVPRIATPRHCLTYRIDCAIRCAVAVGISPTTVTRW